MARINGSKDQWMAALHADGQAFRAAVADADPAAEVPSCPGWTIADLIHHLGSVYTWANLHTIRGVTTPPDRGYTSIAEAPRAADPLAWWDQRFTALLGTLDVLDPEMPAWNWAPQAKKAGFWHRRMAHETAVHRWDAQMASAMAEPIEAKLAADGVSEVLDSYLPAGRRRAQGDFTGLIALNATDIDYVWYARLRGEGIALLDTETIFDDDEHRPHTVAQGPASDLMLAMWGRIGFDVLDVSGDPALLDALVVGA